MAQSAIEWTESTWNPVTGCTKASPGCQNCYAIAMTRRLKAMELAGGEVNGKYRNGFKLTTHPEALDAPKGWRKAKVIFVNSMSDLFHERLPLDFIVKVFDTMNHKDANHHTYQILTKRPHLTARYDPFLAWAPHIWMGTSVENADYRYRIDHLRQCGAQVKFLSLEPLIGEMGKLNLRGIDWVIVGGESGPRARPMQEEWVLEIRDQCETQGVLFFFKQWGGVNKKKAGRLLQGRTWDDMPELQAV